jgi:hypothetical protein
MSLGYRILLQKGYLTRRPLSLFFAAVYSENSKKQRAVRCYFAYQTDAGPGFLRRT